MDEFMNDQYRHFKSLWIGFDLVSMRLGVCVAIYLFLFHQFVGFETSQQYHEGFGAIIGLSVSILCYAGFFLEFYSLKVPAIVVCLISFGQSWRQRNDYFSFLYNSLY